MVPPSEMPSGRRHKCKLHHGNGSFEGLRGESETKGRRSPFLSRGGRDTERMDWGGEDRTRPGGPTLLYRRRGSLANFMKDMGSMDLRGGMGTDATNGLDMSGGLIDDMEGGLFAPENGGELPLWMREVEGGGLAGESRGDLGEGSGRGSGKRGGRLGSGLRLMSSLVGIGDNREPGLSVELNAEFREAQGARARQGLGSGLRSRLNPNPQNLFGRATTGRDRREAEMGARRGPMMQDFEGQHLPPFRRPPRSGPGGLGSLGVGGMRGGLGADFMDHRCQLQNAHARRSPSIGPPGQIFDPYGIDRTSAARGPLRGGQQGGPPSYLSPYLEEYQSAMQAAMQLQFGEGEMMARTGYGPSEQGYCSAPSTSSNADVRGRYFA